MSWSPSDLDAIGRAQEITLLMHRDGHPDLRVPVWAVVAGREVYARSWAGNESKWFRRALADADQAIEVGGRRIPVTFEPVGSENEAAIADGYSAKYGHGSSYVGAMIGPTAVEATVRLTPR